ncbi:helix-turn-helix transcriptional regulator [Rhizobium terrae]|uniref:helix-turn-helix transcriptional regulator n=1 Tax=Rhizobium terrae TaxID=2171756 RepID=UPI000E3DC9D4|nr:response regulator transcription factor [Rhizobium terrae]
MNAIKTLLFICSPGTISIAMTAAIESEFPWLSVTAVHDLRLALVEFDNPVQLVLADAAFAPVLSAHWMEFSSLHGEATLALICNDDSEAAAHQRRAQDFDKIQGIIPFNVNLDVFLSALRIILKGGRYFPPNSYRSRDALTGKRDDEQRESRQLSPATSETRSRTIETLTKRENEILARVAMGNQNKIIAAALGLSEHTVKIHIHNIITKLGVHNRTEVVALYFEQRRKDSSGHAHDPNSHQDDSPLTGDEY